MKQIELCKYTLSKSLKVSSKYYEDETEKRLVEERAWNK